jgi:hypothetical protein
VADKAEEGKLVFVGCDWAKLVVSFVFLWEAPQPVIAIESRLRRESQRIFILKPSLFKSFYFVTCCLPYYIAEDAPGETVAALDTAVTQNVLVIFANFTTAPPGASADRLDLATYFDPMLFGTVYDPPEEKRSLSAYRRCVCP